MAAAAQVDESKVRKHAELQGLNAMERRQVRRGWKRDDDKARELRLRLREEAAAEERLAARRRLDEQRLQQFKQLREGQQGVRYIGGLAVRVRQ